MKHGIVIAALPGELRPLVRGWTHTTRGGADLWQRPASPGAEWTWTAACGGIGRTPALRALAAAEAAGGAAGRIVSVGFAGALSAEHAPGSTFVVSNVIDASTGEHFESGSGVPPLQLGPKAAGTPLLRGPILLTLDHVAGAAEKSRLAAEHHAHLVDMEAAALAQVAQSRGIPFLCIKGVSDGPADQIPSNPSFIDPDGRLRYGSLIAFALWRPSQWGNLIRIGQNSGKAARGLKTALQTVMDDPS